MTAGGWRRVKLRGQAAWRRVYPYRRALLLTLALLTLVIWWLTPRTLQIHNRGPAYAETLYPRPNGFMVQEDRFAFCLRDWQTGRAIWRVRVLARDGGQAALPAGGEEISRFSLSPNGRHLAVATPVGQSVLVRTWRDGLPMGRAAVPFARAARSTAHNPFTLKVLDNGRVLLWNRVAKQTIVYAVEGDRLAAIGQLSCELPGAYAQRLYRTYLSPDGTMMLATALYGFALYDITVRGETIIFRQRQAGDTRGGSLTIFPGGVLLEQTGQVYRRDQPPTVDASWVELSYAASGDFTLQRHARTAGRFRVFAPRTDRAWGGRAPGVLYNGGSVSANGRFALVFHQAGGHARRVARPVRNLLSRFPAGERYLDYRLPERRSVTLYQWPGWRCAHAALDKGWEWPGEDSTLLRGYPSARGHTVVVAAGKANKKQLQWMLLTW